MQVELLSAFTDNYIFVGSKSEGTCFVVDPGQAAPVLKFLRESGATLAAILITHHHADHIGDVEDIISSTNCKRIIGPAYDQKRISFLTEAVQAGDQTEICGARAEVLFVPGHTLGHISYYFPTEKALFCGDTLFSVGCGRMFEGSREQMWGSLEQLRSLPDDTRVYCAHEYTLANIRFAQSIDSSNDELNAYADACTKLRYYGLPTIPSTIGIEKSINPFLKVDQKVISEKIGMANKLPAVVFGELRRLKDEF